MSTTDAEKMRRELDRFNQKIAELDHALTLRSQWQISLWEATSGKIELPWSPQYESEYVTQYEPTPTNEDGTYDYNAPRVIDIDATNKIIAMVIQHATRKGLLVEKKYDDKQFRVVVTLWLAEEHSTDRYRPDVTMTYIASRESVCTKVVTGKKVIPAVPEHTEDEYTWDCTKVSFLGMDVDN